jgi:hypothetical protein
LKRHRLDPVVLVFGVIFVGLGVLGMIGDFESLDWRWVWPLPVIAIGLAFLGSALLHARDERRSDDAS